MSEIDGIADETLRTIREQVADLHAELPKNGLVMWTGGNISARVPGSDHFVIKPSGVDYTDLVPENMVLCDRDGRAVPGSVGCEDSARTVHLARQIGTPVPIDPDHVDALFDRYQNVYGQQPHGDM